MHNRTFLPLLAAALLAGCSTSGSYSDSGGSNSGSGGGGGASGNGASLYASNCAGCHGANAQGGAGPALAGISESNRVIDIILNGGSTMPGFGGSLSDADVSNILAWLGGL